MILILVWAIIMTATLIILVIILLNLKKKHDHDIFDKENEIQEINLAIEKERIEQQEKFRTTIIKERSNANESSRHTLKGKIGEQMSPLFPEFYSKYQPSDARFLGSPIDYIIFKHMSEYDSKTKAVDVPIDVVLVEVKSAKKTGLTEKEKAVRIAVEEGRVSFDVVRQNLEPEKKLTQEERHEKKELQKIEAKKDHPTAYEPWTVSDDEFLKNYWNDESNKQSSDEKIQALCEKLDRSKGGIKSRLKKTGLV
jgi:predicted Holliday junction resolvase-like endonuclease